MSGIGVLGVLASPGSLVHWVAYHDLQGWFKHFLKLANAKQLKNIPDGLIAQASEHASMPCYSSLQTADAHWYQYGNGDYAFPCWQQQHATEGLLYMYLPVYHTQDGGQTWRLLTTLSHFHLEAFARMDVSGNAPEDYLLPVYTDKSLPSQLTPGYGYATAKGFLQLVPQIHADGMVMKIALLNQQVEEHFTSHLRSLHLKSNHRLFIYA